MVMVKPSCGILSAIERELFGVVLEEGDSPSTFFTGNSAGREALFDGLHVVGDVAQPLGGDS